MPLVVGEIKMVWKRSLTSWKPHRLEGGEGRTCYYRCKLYTRSVMRFYHIFKNQTRILLLQLIVILSQPGCQEWLTQSVRVFVLEYNEILSWKYLKKVAQTSQPKPNQLSLYRMIKLSNDLKEIFMAHRREWKLAARRAGAAETKGRDKKDNKKKNMKGENITFRRACPPSSKSIISLSWVPPSFCTRLLIGNSRISLMAWKICSRVDTTLFLCVKYLFTCGPLSEGRYNNNISRENRVVNVSGEAKCQQWTCNICQHYITTVKARYAKI